MNMNSSAWMIGSALIGAGIMVIEEGVLAGALIFIGLTLLGFAIDGESDKP